MSSGKLLKGSIFKSKTLICSIFFPLAFCEATICLIIAFSMFKFEFSKGSAVSPCSALNEISKTSKDILELLKTPESSKSDTLEAKIDETNRLLKLLCIGILGKDKE
mgnify:CR=1 FL=1